MIRHYPLIIVLQRNLVIAIAKQTIHNQLITNLVYYCL